METRTVKISIFLSAIFAIALLFSQTGVSSAHEMHGGPIEFYLMHQDQIGLTADQVTKLRKINLTFQKVRVMEKARIHVIHMEGMQLLMQKDVNTNALKKDINRVLQHKKAIMVARVEMLSDAHKILTDEQFSKVKMLWRQMMMHHGMPPMMAHPPVGH